MFGGEGQPPDFDRTFCLFLKEAQMGNTISMHDLRRMFEDGLGREKDRSRTTSTPNTLWPACTHGDREWNRKIRQYACATKRQRNRTTILPPVCWRKTLLTRRDG